ncbi:MAG TPA: TonB-dependent receptor [Anaeromyxobacter sp.]|nr:TonB-dependent receptor [Anaeromyxobacter sp.]
MLSKAAVCLLAVALALPARGEEPGAVQQAAPETSSNPTPIPTPTPTPTPSSTSDSTPTPTPTATDDAAAGERSRPGDDKKFGETISVTATRTARRTRDVPQAIAVVGKDQLEDKVVFNVRDVVAGTPGVLVDTKNSGYDARLLIRGAGLKANYGVREIMVLRDGVPLTDPDSFTRLDFVDMQDVERIEIAKGPGNLFSPGSAGGAIQILSRSVFDAGADTARASFGTFGSATAHLRASRSLGENAVALTASYRQQDNDWRLWNEFKTMQVSLKHGVPLGEAGTLESEAAYTQADTQLPGVMDRDLYATFADTGEQHATSEPWKHSGRYSKILFFNSKLEQRLGDFVLKPRVYFNQWTHLHPVTGFINDTRDWTRTLGTDLEAQHEHALAGVGGTLVAGATVKGQWNPDIHRYKYRDIVEGVPPGSRPGTPPKILATLSDAEGELMETQRQENVLYGVFAQETLRPHERVVVDLGFRYDRSTFHISEDEIWKYDWAVGNYATGGGYSTVNKTFDLPAPKAGVSVRATKAVSLYASAARASQIPSDSEIGSNPDLDAAVTTSYETGVKVRAPWATLDLAGYWMDVRDEIVQSVVLGETKFMNAGQTRKRGAEIAGSVRILDGLEAGASYGYADYRYVHFTEVVRGEPKARDGKRLPYVPQHQYGVFASWRHPAGLRLRVQANTWARYWMDNANTATYPGYAFLTSFGAAWAFGRHEVLLDVENAFDQHYAMQAVRDATGTKDTFAAGTPRYVSFGYRFGL